MCEAFEEKLEKINHFKHFEDMVSGLEMKGRVWKKYMDFKEKKSSLGSILIGVLREWLWRFLRKVDAEIINKIALAVKQSATSRTELLDTVHNFSGKSVPNKVIESLKLGSNFVVHTKMNEIDARRKMESELLSFLMKYRRYIERKESINCEDLQAWLKIAIDETEVKTHNEFYSSLLCFSAIDMGIGKRIGDGKGPEFMKLDRMGVAVVEADKGMGICLINIEDLVIADQDLVNEMGGVKCIGKSTEDMKNELVEKAEEFERSLDAESKKFLRTYYGSRYEKMSDSELPFLKVRPKLHKLSELQLQNKDAKELKYRPVVDASRTPLGSYSQCLMEYLRDLMRKAEAKYFDGDGTMLKNGHAMRETIDKLAKSEEKLSMILTTADLSSAYTFIYLENLLIAMNFLGSQLGIPEWKRKFQEGVATLVLNNSVIETTDGIFKLNSCLPMGLSCSGECMDVVLLVAELVLLGKVEAEKVPGFLDQYGGIKPEPMQGEAETFHTYKRYRDDTFSCFSPKKTKACMEFMMILGRAFIPTLDINIEMSNYVGTFLDVKFIKRFSGTGFETFLKRKGKFPITFCHESSNTSNSIVRSIVSGEILRHRRLTSNRIIQTANDECLVLELESRGYKESFLKKIVQERIQKIGSEYNHKYVRNKMRENPEGLVYGAVSVFDEEWNTHYKLHRLLKQSMPIGVR